MAGLSSISSSRITRRAAAGLLAFFCLFPFAYLFVLSFADAWPFPDLWPSRFSLNVWMGLLGGNAGLGESFLVSCWISILVALLSTGAGYVTGKYIAYHRHRETFLFMAYVPFIMSPVILGTCLMFLYIKANLVGSVTGVVIAQTMFAYGFSIVFFSAFWNHEIKGLEDLVYTLGGSTWQAYRRVLLPISMGMLLICFFQTFLISWFQYGLTILIGSGKVQTLPLKVYDFINEANIYYAALASCLLVIPPALLLWVNKRYVFRIGG